MSSDLLDPDAAFQLVRDRLAERNVELTDADRAELHTLITSGVAAGHSLSADELRTALEQLATTVENRPVVAVHLDRQGRVDDHRYLRDPDEGWNVVVPVSIREAVCPSWPWC